MSIIIKSEQVNTLIYKYLQEQNLSHTAFTLYNEAQLEPTLLQYKFDIKAGQLISIIERALIFAQIESHITINQYEECKEAFCLLKPHVCKITQRIREEKEALFQELNQKVFEVMRRTSSVHNNLQPNKEFEEIIYEQRSANFFDRVPLRLAESSQLTLKASLGQFPLSQKYFIAYEAETLTMTIMTKKDNYLSTMAILPCKAMVTAFQIVDDLLVVVYEGNQCEVVQLEGEGFKEEIVRFKVEFGAECREVKGNRRIKNLLAFQAGLEYCVINLNTRRQLAKGKGIFEWVDYFSYLVLQSSQKIIKRCSLKPDEEHIKQFFCPLMQANKIQISSSEIYFSVESLAQNTVLVYNFDQAQPLYIFNFSPNSPTSPSSSPTPNNQDQPHREQLQQSLWVTANSADNIILITDASIKTFEIELNNFSKIIEISAYDREILHAQPMNKNDEQDYLILLGLDNLVFYDVSLGKIQRVAFSEDVRPYGLVKLDQGDFVGAVAEDRICILQKSDIEPLFI